MFPDDGFLPTVGNFRDHVLLLLLFAGLFIMIIGWVRRVCAQRLCSRCCRLITLLCRRLTCKRQDNQVKHAEDPVARIVNERVIEQRVTYVRQAINIISIVSLNCTVIIIISIMSGSPRVVSPQLEVLHTLVQAYCGVVSLRPEFITKRNFTLHYAVLQLYFAASVSPWVEPGMLFPMFVNVVVIGLNLARGTTGCRALFFSCNAVYITAACVSFWQYGSGCWSNKQPSWFYASAQALAMSAFCVIVDKLDGSHLSAMLQSLQLKEARDRHGAAFALLRSICDVVVEVDADRRIVSPESNLASLLGLARPLQGVPLDSLFKEEGDRTTLKERMESAKQEEGLAETMQVTLVDGWGSPVRVELFWFLFDHLESQRPHAMLGIKEFGETAHPPGMGGQDTFPVLPLAEISPSLAGSVGSGSGHESVIGGEISAVVDFAQEGYPIQSLNVNFITQIGRLPVGSPLLNHITKPQPFLFWAHDGLNHLFHGSDHEPCRVSFRMPQGKVTTKCYFAPTGPDGFDIHRVTLLFWKRVASEDSGEEQVSRRGTPRVASSHMRI